MRVFVIDPVESYREMLAARVREALRQTGLRRVDVVVGGFDRLGGDYGEEPSGVGFLGPGCSDSLDSAIADFRRFYPSLPLALVLSNESYASDAVDVRRRMNVRTMPIADIAQMAQFILDYDGRLVQGREAKARGIVSVCQLKGGVGGTTVAAALGSCWERNGRSVVLVDLDDVNPQLTAWGEVDLAKRRAVTELLREGEVTTHRVPEVLHRVDGFEQLALVGQPEFYRESFHFKADILENAPSAADFVRSLLSSLSSHFDVVVVDTGRSWGIATFASFLVSQHVLLVIDQKELSLTRTLENMKRLYRESDDPEEFDLSRWKVLINRSTMDAWSNEKVRAQIAEIELFPDAIPLFRLSTSTRPALWDRPGATLFTEGEDRITSALSSLAFSLVPFHQQYHNGSLINRLYRSVSRFVER